MILRVLAAPVFAALIQEGVILTEAWTEEILKSKDPKK